MHDSERLTYTAPELAQVLGIGRTTAYNLMNRAGFPSFRIGSKPVVRRAALEAWIEKQEKEQQNEN